jgi:hypothetical protein
MDTVTEVAQRVLEANATQLAGAADTDAVRQLAPQIAKEIENSYNPQSDPFAYRAVIIILGIVVVAVAITYAWYTLTPDVPATANSPGVKLRDLPDAFIALGSAAVGALAGLLAPAPRK